MTQRQTQRKFGLLQRHFSQQETIPVLAISPSSILPDNVIPQAGTEHTGPTTLGLARHRAMPTNLDLTTYQMVPTTPYPLLDQAMPTTSYPLLDQAMSITPDIDSDEEMPIAVYPKKSWVLRVVAVMIILALPLALYLIWRPAPSVSSSPVITSQNFSEATPKVSSSESSTATDATGNSTGDIQAYIVGAVEHPGVYTLPAHARVYQLLQAAGGPSPNADLVALNLATKLNDGQEVYVTAIGESPPSGVSGPSTSSSSSTASAQGQQLVNINTASADEMEQQLHISSKTAQTIISYRQQHGPFTSVSQLSQVVSQSIYDKIKNEVTV
jgi:competence protein ComEA